MRGWFFLERGRVYGPVAIEKLSRRINQYEMGALDLICREGEDYWMGAGTFKEFASQFESPNTSGDWVVLKNEDGKYIQRGLFSSSELKDLVKDGFIRGTDFAWCSGMKKWIRISGLELFKESQGKFVANVGASSGSTQRASSATTSTSTSASTPPPISTKDRQPSLQKVSRDKFLDSVMREPMVDMPDFDETLDFDEIPSSDDISNFDEIQRDSWGPPKL